MKKLFIVMLVLAMVFSVAACEQKEVEQTPAANGEESGLSANLVYWSMWNQTEPQAIALQEAIDDFMAKNPGVQVEVNWNGREIRKTLQPALDSGETIDIWDEDLERTIQTWGQYALALDGYYQQSFPTTGDSTYEESVMGVATQMAKDIAVIARGKGVELEGDGEIYAVPYQPYVFCYMYNKEHFAEVGIESTPTNWEEFMAACAKLKDAGYEPVTTDDAYVDIAFGTHLAKMKGSDWVEGLMNGENSWDDPAVLATAKAFEEMATNGYFSANIGSNKWPAGQQDVANGTVSMYLNGTWLVNEIMPVTGPEFAWGQFVYPNVDDGLGEYAATYAFQSFQINKNCENPDVAFALLAHLTTGEWDAKLAEGSYGVPVGGTTEWPVQLADAKEIFSNLEVRYPWAAGAGANPEVQPVLAENFTKLISGTITAEEFVENMK